MSSRTALRVLPPDRARPAGDLDSLKLEGRAVTAQIGDRLISGSLDRTIEGPNVPTLNIWDGDTSFLGSGVLGEKVMTKTARLELDGLAYIATGTSKSGDIVAVTFEDEPVTIAKRHGLGKPRRFPADTSTRAQACATLLREAGVAVIVLDENVIQPRSKTDVAGAVKTAKGAAKGKGRSSSKGMVGAGLTVKGKPATDEQRRSARTALQEADKLKASTKVMLTMLCAAIGESDLRPVPNASGSVYAGVFMANPNAIPQADTAQQAHYFLIGGKGFQAGGAIHLARQEPTLTEGEIATRVEAGGAPGNFYGQHLPEAKAWLAAWRGSSDAVTSDDTTYVKAAYERKKDESTYAACYRMLVTEVKWRLFVREGVFVIASDAALMRSASTLTIHARDLDFDDHRALAVSEGTATIAAGRYDIDPGEVLEVDGLPQVKRTWLIGTVGVSLTSDQLTTVGIRKPQAASKEPALLTKTSTRSTRSTRSTIANKDLPDGLDADSHAARAYAEAKRISLQNLPYVWGGGHAHCGTPDGGTGRDPGTGYDCSGYTTAQLAAAGLGFTLGGPGAGSGQLMSWGEAGEGKYLTVYASLTHVFVVYHGFAMASADTRRIASSQPGPHLRSAVGPSAGFVARRWPGV